MKIVRIPAHCPRCNDAFEAFDIDCMNCHKTIATNLKVIDTEFKLPEYTPQQEYLLGAGVLCDPPTRAQRKRSLKNHDCKKEFRTDCPKCT